VPDQARFKSCLDPTALKNTRIEKKQFNAIEYEKEKEGNTMNSMSKLFFSGGMKSFILLLAAVMYSGCSCDEKSEEVDGDAGDGADQELDDMVIDVVPDGVDVPDMVGDDVPDAADVPGDEVSDADDITDAPEIPGVCGNGTMEVSEKCDDSNLTNGDGCNPTCDLWGTVATVAGSASASGSTDGVGTAARFDTPSGITTDGSSIYVSDTTNCTIRKIDIATWTVTTLAGSAGSCGHADGAGSAARFYIAQDLAYDSGFIYVADTDNHVIRQVDAATGNTTTIAGTPGTASAADGTGNAAGFNEPRGITTDGTHLYVADFGNHTIRRIAIGSWAVTTIAGAAGTAGSADGVGSAAGFNFPRSIVVSGATLYVSDTNNHTIRQIDIASQNVTTIAGTAGSAGSADGTGPAARFNSPRGLTVDAESLYVSDTGNNTIRQILLGTWDVSTLCGSAGASGSSDGTGAAARMDGPWGLVFDISSSTPDQKLYVADTNNNIIRTID